MKWVLVNKFDEIVDTCEIASGVGASGAKTYFRKTKRMETADFDKLWKVMSKNEYDRIFKNNLQNRQMDKRKYEWWKDIGESGNLEEETYLSEDNDGRKTEG